MRLSLFAREGPSIRSASGVGALSLVSTLLDFAVSETHRPWTLGCPCPGSRSGADGSLHEEFAASRSLLLLEAIPRSEENDCSRLDDLPFGLVTACGSTATIAPAADVLLPLEPPSRLGERERSDLRCRPRRRRSKSGLVSLSPCMTSASELAAAATIAISREVSDRENTNELGPEVVGVEAIASPHRAYG